MIDINNLRRLKNCISELIENEKLEEAMLKVVEYESMYPHDLDIYTIKATMLFYNKKYNEAENVLMNIYHKYEYNADVNYNLGIIYYFKKEYIKALEYFFKVNFIDIDKMEYLNEFMEDALSNVSEEEINKLKDKVTFYFNNMQRMFPCDGSGNFEFGKSIFKNKDQEYYCGIYDYYYLERDNIFLENDSRLKNIIKTEVIPADVLSNFKFKLEEDTIIPLMVKKHYQDIEININNKSNNLKNLLKDRFYYYKFNKGDTVRIKSNDDFVLGKKIEENKSGKLPSLVLNIFIDGLSQKFIEENNLKSFMPNTYKFFKEGTICNNTYVTGEWTYVSLASFFTGKTTVNHRVFHPNFDTNNIVRTELYSEIFQKKGYFTAKIDGDWRSNPSMGYLKGIDRYLYQPSVRGMHCDEVIMETIEHLETFKKNDNFLWVCIPDLHDIADEYETRISTQVKSSIDCRAFEKSEGTSVRKKMDDRKKERFGIQLKRIDTYLSLLFNYINENYKQDDFVISLVADHGQGYLVNSDEFLDEERIKVPMMLRGKNIPIGKCDEFIAALDLFPIILNSINIDDYSKKDGYIPKYFGGETGREYVYSETIFPGSPYQATINDRDYKFFFKSIKNCTKDGRIELDDYKVSLIRKSTGQDESEKELDKVSEYINKVFNHIREYMII
ncbi:sulfatase [Clostridium botulinum]|nr:sulfatase [Clostridium botulinum]